LQIGNISFKNPVISAPLAGISDRAFRKIARDFGCGLVYSEMISSMALVYENKRTRFKATFKEEEKPVNAQIAGWRADIMAEAARIAESMGADMIDINAGCSVRKVLKNKEGAYLLKDFSMAKEIIGAVVRAVKVPVTIKIRKAWDGSYEKTLEFARMAEGEGVSAIAIHGRTPAQKFGGIVDLEIIRLLKEKLSIKVIGNGDIKSAEDAVNLIKTTGCDGIMIGRASMGNPWIFAQVLSALEGRDIPPKPCVEERINFALYHYNLFKDYHGKTSALTEMRKFFAWYIKGLRGASRIREKIFTLNNYDEVVNLLIDYRDTFL